LSQETNISARTTWTISHFPQSYGNPLKP